MHHWSQVVSALALFGWTIACVYFIALFLKLVANLLENDLFGSLSKGDLHVFVGFGWSLKHESKIFIFHELFSLFQGHLTFELSIFLSPNQSKNGFLGAILNGLSVPVLQFLKRGQTKYKAKYFAIL